MPRKRLGNQKPTFSARLPYSKSLGTPIASLASLISLKLYSHADEAHTGRYLLEFTLVNLLFLLLLSAALLVLPA